MTVAERTRYATARMRLALLVTAAALVGKLGLLLTTSGAGDGDEETSSPPRRQRRRLASLAEFAYPSSMTRKVPLTIYLTYPPKMHEARFFVQKTFHRYTTGRIKYNVVEHDGMKPTDDGGPCLAATNSKEKGNYEALVSNYPNCLTMVSNDEQCKSPQYDVRQYYASDFRGVYIPLGPRYDSYMSLRKIEQRPGFAMKLPSQRKYAFNALFSKSTNCDERCPLSDILSDKADPDVETFVAVVEWWKAQNPLLLDTDSYMAILLDSTFTLAPTGRNPECFRLYEAIEAGSIPIMTKSTKRCKDGMRYWYDAPMVFLDTWDDLYPTVKKLMADPVALDNMMINLRLWYDNGFMGRHIVAFEDYVIDAYANKDMVGG